MILSDTFLFAVTLLTKEIVRRSKLEHLATKPIFKLLPSQSSHYMEHPDDFHYVKEFPLHKESHHTRYHQIDTFDTNNDEWNTKEDTGKFMKNALYVLQ